MSRSSSTSKEMLARRVNSGSAFNLEYRTTVNSDSDEYTMEISYSTAVEDSSSEADDKSSQEAPVKWSYVAVTAVASCGISAAQFVPITLLLPMMCEIIDPDAKTASLAWVSGIGAAATVIGTPIAGAISDTWTTKRMGRRRPYVLLGGVVGTAGLFLLQFMPSTFALAFMWMLCQFSINLAYAAVTASIPDQCPAYQRGMLSGVNSVAQIVGTVGCLAIAAEFSLLAGSFAVAGFFLASTMPFVFRPYDLRLDPPGTVAESWMATLHRFWVNPIKHPDFFWAWMTRFFVGLSNSVAIVYLYYFLQDAVKVSDPANAQLLLTGLYAAGVCVASVTFGKLSDVLQRRKIFVFASTALMAACGAVEGVFELIGVTIAVSIFSGIGYGTYGSVDQALITQVLPSAKDRGSHLGVMNIASALPQVLAPVVAAPLVNSNGKYLALFIFAAALAGVGALCVTRIKSVR